MGFLNPWIYQTWAKDKEAYFDVVKRARTRIVLHRWIHSCACLRLHIRCWHAFDAHPGEVRLIIQQVKTTRLRFFHWCIVVVLQMKLQTANCISVSSAIIDCSLHESSDWQANFSRKHD
jgi:hypothetical protein